MCHGKRVGEVLDHDSCQKPDSTHWGWDGFISGNSIENSTSTFHMKEVIDTGIDRPWISSVDGRCVSIIPATYGVGSVVAGALWSSIVGDIRTVWNAWCFEAQNCRYPALFAFIQPCDAALTGIMDPIWLVFDICPAYAVSLQSRNPRCQTVHSND